MTFEERTAVLRRGLIAIIDRVESYAHGDDCEFAGEMVGDERSENCGCGLSTIRTLAWAAVRAADAEQNEQWYESRFNGR